MTAAFEAALKAGQIRMDDLFDENYRPIPNTDPQQVMTRFTAFTDKVLPAIQEPVLKRDPRIVFCAAVDRNGDPPTHNQIYSQPQGDDPVWNAANCRNRRIFNDRTGLAAGRNRRKFLLQTYRRDMGNGNYVLMKDASVPIKLDGGRHWGGLRIGFRPGEPIKSGERALQCGRAAGDGGVGRLHEAAHGDEAVDHAREVRALHRDAGFFQRVRVGLAFVAQHVVAAGDDVRGRQARKACRADGRRTPVIDAIARVLAEVMVAEPLHRLLGQWQDRRAM